MVDSEFVAVGAETQARLTDVGVMPKPGGEGEQAKPDYRRQGPMRHDCHDGLRRGSRQPDPRADRLRGRLHRAEDVRRDRKSTRLNSSHSQISYAVFCLKKKKKKNTMITVISKKTTTTNNR